MKSWAERPKEIAYLLNPAFCARLLYSTIRAYNTETKRAFPLALIYLILPLLLHRRTRVAISSKTQMIIWIQRNAELLIGFAERTKNMVPITNEALEMLLQCDALSLTADAELECSWTKKPLSKKKYIDAEIQECLTKSEHIARWFAKAGKTELIYISLGVRP